LFCSSYSAGDLKNATLLPVQIRGHQELKLGSLDEAYGNRSSKLKVSETSSFKEAEKK
jgi:hypothetical protein